MPIPDKQRSARKGGRVQAFDPSKLQQLIDQRHEGNVAAAARHSGISQPTLFNILNGKYAPRADTIAKLSRAYGVTLDFASGRAERVHDDTFASGAHAALRLMRRELDRIEVEIESGDLGPGGRAVHTAARELPPSSASTPGGPRAANPGEKVAKATPSKSSKKRA